MCLYDHRSQNNCVRFLRQAISTRSASFSRTNMVGSCGIFCDGGIECDGCTKSSESIAVANSHRCWSEHIAKHFMDSPILSTWRCMGHRDELYCRLGVVSALIAANSSANPSGIGVCCPYSTDRTSFGVFGRTCRLPAVDCNFVSLNHLCLRHVDDRN